MSRKEVAQATISLKEYISEFMEVPQSGATGSVTIVKGCFYQNGTLRFSKVFKGGENKGENAELQLAKELKVFHGKDKNIKGQCEIKVLSNKSPSIISAEQFAQFYRDIKMKTPTTFNINFAHPCSYVNQRALSNLNRVGIKLKVLTVEDILTEAFKDLNVNIGTLHNLSGIQKSRHCKLMVDDIMLQAFLFLMANSVEIDGMTLSERKEKNMSSHDKYVSKLKTELKKKSKSIGDEPLTVRPMTSHSFLRQGSSTNKKKKEELQYMIDAREDKQMIPFLTFHDYKKEFLLYDADSARLSRTRLAEGVWKIGCRNNSGHLLKTFKGVMQRVDGGQNNEMAIEEVTRQITNVISSQGASNVKVALEVVLVSLPDKTNVLKQISQLLNHVTENFGKNIKLNVRYIGLESVSMPAKSWLKKLNSTPDVSITPLHIQDVINVLIGDIENVICNMHWCGLNRGVTVKVDADCLHTALHVLKSAIGICQGKVKNRITDGDLTNIIQDEHYIQTMEKFKELMA